MRDDKKRRIYRYCKKRKKTKNLFYLCVLMLFAGGFNGVLSQEQERLSIFVEKVSLKQFFEEVEKNSAYKFSYRDIVLRDKKDVTLNENSASIESILDIVLPPRGLNYTINGYAVMIIKKDQMEATKEKVNITGTILDEEGYPVIGANVVEKGTTNGVVTDLDGKFSIQVKDDAVLQISYIGYADQEIQVAGKTAFNISMREDTQLLEEVVVVGYGVQKKVNLTGAVASINSKQIEDRPSENILKSLQGAVPGVTIISRPGGTSINIRGRGNLGSSSPLYIVDGIEVSSDYFNSLEPASIETISFLKDASSAAIYGSKAAYGVILVTTKSGEKGKLQVTYNGSVGWQSPTYMPEVLNSWEYAQMYKEAEINSGISSENLTYTDEDIEKYRKGDDLDRYPNTNWFDEVLKDNSLFTKHNFNFSGGGEKVRYILGLGYLKDETLTPGEADNRYNFSSRTAADLKPWLTVSSITSFIYKKYKREKGEANFVRFLTMPPTQVARHTNGEWGSVRDGREMTSGEANSNPLRTHEEDGRANSDTKHFLGTISAEIKPCEGVKITNQLGYRYWDYRGFTFQNKKDGIPSFLNPSSGIIPGTASEVNQMNMDWQYSEKLIYDGWINFDKTVNKIHDLTGVLGIHADDYTFKNLKVGRKGFASNEMNAISGGSVDPTNQITTTGDVREESTLSFFGRAGYTYKQKYLFEANLRADASSRFAKKGRWGYFPSLSAGWRIDQEDFFTRDWLSSLKIRGSWGQNGNINNVGLYDTYSTFEASGTTLIGGQIVSTLNEGRVGNSNLTWETTTTTDLGVDIIIENGLLGITFDYYNRTTDDILVRANDVFSETGLSSDNIPARNVGTVRNRGVELIVTHEKQINDFSYNIGVNMTVNKNKIIDLGDKVDQLPPGSYYILKKGESVGDFYMYEVDGLYSTDDIENGNVTPFGTQMPEAGMVKYIDQLTEDSNNDGIADKADGVINEKDRNIVGNEFPNFTYGTNIELNYKNITFSLVGQGVAGVEVYMDNEAAQAFFNSAVPRKWQRDNWTVANQDAVYPKLFVPTDMRYKYNSMTSSYWLFNASYFRIKNISLSYAVPKRIISAAGFDSARIFFSGDNLFTIRGDKRMRDFDPERSSGRGSQLGMKTFSTGISLTF